MRVVCTNRVDWSAARRTQKSAVGTGPGSGGIGAFFFLAVFLRLRAGAPRFAFLDFFAMFSPDWLNEIMREKV